MHFIPASVPVALDRKFHLSSLGGVHGQVLFRSGMVTMRGGELVESADMVDVVFADVLALAVRDSYDSMEISLAPTSEFVKLSDLLGWGMDLEGRKVYQLKSGICSGYVVAGSLAWAEVPGGDASAESPINGHPKDAVNLNVYTA